MCAVVCVDMCGCGICCGDVLYSVTWGECVCLVCVLRCHHCGVCVCVCRVLYYNAITSISSGAFEGLGSLRELCAHRWCGV